MPEVGQLLSQDQDHDDEHATPIWRGSEVERSDGVRFGDALRSSRGGPPPTVSLLSSPRWLLRQPRAHRRGEARLARRRRRALARLSSRRGRKPPQIGLLSSFWAWITSAAGLGGACCEFLYNLFAALVVIVVILCIAFLATQLQLSFNQFSLAAQGRQDTFMLVVPFLLVLAMIINKGVSAHSGGLFKVTKLVVVLSVLPAGESVIKAIVAVSCFMALLAWSSRASSRRRSGRLCGLSASPPTRASGWRRRKGKKKVQGRRSSTRPCSRGVHELAAARRFLGLIGKVGDLPAARQRWKAAKMVPPQVTLLLSGMFGDLGRRAGDDVRAMSLFSDMCEHLQGLLPEGEWLKVKSKLEALGVGVYCDENELIDILMAYIPMLYGLDYESDGGVVYGCPQKRRRSRRRRFTPAAKVLKQNIVELLRSANQRMCIELNHAFNINGCIFNMFMLSRRSSPRPFIHLQQRHATKSDTEVRPKPCGRMR